MFSPTSIADFLACQHLSALNRAEAAAKIKKPYFADPLLDFLIRLGEAHEQAYLTQLAEQGLTIVEIPTDGSRREAAERTIEAIRGGAEVIYQPTLRAAGSDSEPMLRTRTRPFPGGEEKMRTRTQPLPEGEKKTAPGTDSNLASMLHCELRNSVQI